MYHDIKGKLARLLATENLVVEHKQVETAQFDVESRVLTLPIWKITSNNVYDTLVAHEVGHALFTPFRDWINEDDYRYVPHAFVNIIEDVRIEKLMKRKYNGLNKTFYHGYSQLHSEDFFEIDKDLSEFSFPDRINLDAKIGSFEDIEFSDEERELYDRIKEVETFDDTLNLALELKDFCQKKQEEKKVEKVAQVQTPTNNFDAPVGEDTDLAMPVTPTQEDQEGQSEESGEEETVGESDQSQGGKNGGDPFDTETVDSLENKLKDLVDTNAAETVYVEVPKIDLENTIVSTDDIREFLQTYWNIEKAARNEMRREHDLPFIDAFEDVDNDYESFKKSAQKEVNYLVKEFECKKSASAYARAATSKTGLLDLGKLHTYKFNEDLFKKVTVLPDGKNHGLIFILDWSGSMANTLLDTVKQLLNLVWFCKKTSIPFDVYAFSNEWFVGEVRAGIKCERKEHDFYIQNEFGLLNIISSSSKELDLDIRNLFRMAYYMSRRCNTWYSVPRQLSLSGTPLNESLIALHQIIPDFKKRTNAEKVQCIIFTDGEAQTLRRNKIVKRGWEDHPYMGCAAIHTNCFLRNRKTGRITKFGHYWTDFTKLLLTDLKSLYPEVNFIGFRVLANRDVKTFIHQQLDYGSSYEKVRKEWKKNKSFSLEGTGYGKYFGISSSALNDDVDFEVKEDASKAQIKSAFKKSLAAKKTNKKILNEFVDLIA